jgi:uncharacterized protein Yka (UPF0111/DUF47 family)
VALFRKQPDDRLLDLLEEAGTNASRTTSLLLEMLTGFPERSHLAREILLREQEGDRIAHDVIHRIAQAPKRAALDPRDVYDLVHALDDIVDHAEETADSLDVYGIEAPMDQSVQLAEVLSRAALAVESALAALRAGEALNGHLVDIHALENEGDRVSREAIASLFATGIDPMVVIRWKDVFESLEQAIDACETVAHVLEGITLKRQR